MVVSEADTTRALVARALVAVFVAYEGSVREAAAKGILMTAHESSAALVQVAQAEAANETLRVELKRLAHRLASNPVR